MNISQRRSRILGQSKIELYQLCTHYHIEKMPLLMIELILEQEQSMLNAFTTKTGISTTLPEINIVEGRPSLDYSTMSLKIRAYIQLYEGTKNM